MGVVFMSGPRRVWKILLEKFELEISPANNRVCFERPVWEDVD
jgi:hypothetical protein